MGEGVKLGLSFTLATKGPPCLQGTFSYLSSPPRVGYIEGAKATYALKAFGHFHYRV
jgi:hypothetical protein